MADRTKKPKENVVKLHRNEYCPIHHSLFCSGREKTPKECRLQLGIQRIDDRDHPRGYRELRSPAEMRKLLNRKIVAQDRKCAICQKEFNDYNDIVPDHGCPDGHGRRSARRPSRKHPSCALVVQLKKGIEQNRGVTGDQA